MKNTLQEMFELLQAEEDGKEIEYQEPGCPFVKKLIGYWNFHDLKYRIKEEPKKPVKFTDR